MMSHRTLLVAAPLVALLSASTAGTQGSPSQSGARPVQPGSESESGVTVLEGPVLEGTDTMSARFRINTGVTQSPAAVPCGPKRARQSGWDLRLPSVSAPSRVVAMAMPLPVTLVVDNAGRSASPASEVKICIACAVATGCERSLELVPIPALGPGERAEIRRSEAGTSIGRAPFRIAALIDPDRATGEKRTDKNQAASDRLEVESPSLERITFEPVGGYEIGHPLVFHVRIRNKSFIAASQPTEVPISYRWGLWPAHTVSARGARSNFTAVNGHFGDRRSSLNRVAIPSIGPRQQVVMKVAAQNIMRCDAATQLEANIELDPDAQLTWGSTHQRSVTTGLPAVR